MDGEPVVATPSPHRIWDDTSRWSQGAKGLDGLLLRMQLYANVASGFLEGGIRSRCFKDSLACIWDFQY